MNELFEVLNSYIRAELFILIPVICIINKILLKSKVNDSHIPYILLTLCIILCGIYTFATLPITTIPQVLFAIFTSATQGILISGTSFYVDNIGSLLSYKKDNKV
ncbi:MAG: phage holin family protein [Clostridia bacterium]